MKRFFILLLSLILLLLPILSSCKGAPNTDTPAETSISSSERLEDVIYKIISREGCDYTIVYPNDAKGQVASAMAKIYNKILSVYGIEVAHGRDSEIAESEFEILIGLTNRKESQEIHKKLRLGESVITMVGSKLVIIGDDDRTTLSAAAQFTELLDSSEISFAADKEVKNNLIDYPVNQITINGINVKDYVIAYAPSTAESPNYKDCSRVINNRLIDIAGISLNIIPAEQASSYEHVIAVGQSSLFPSEQTLASGSYRLGVKNSLIYIDGDTTYTLKSGLKAFADEYFPSDASSDLELEITDFEKTETPPSLGRIRLLAIGNSWSDDAFEHLWNILHDAGYEDITLGNLAKGGATIENHWTLAQNNQAQYKFRLNTNGQWVTGSDDVNLKYGLTYTEWDIISLQQATSGGVESYYKNLDNFYNYVNNTATKSADCKIVWQMVWALAKGLNHSSQKLYDYDQAKNYSMIVDATKKYVDSGDKYEVIIPSGTSIQNMRTSFIGENLVRDSAHLSLGLGRYLVSMSWYVTLFGGDPDLITWYPTAYDYIGEAELAAIREAVTAADATPFAVTQSSYR
ncbi:MAG: DUF4886 domain-containing protein [Clostridia bacterium]|nr:DUF4886 domain-containing protein [Clostridia bacterium]